MTEGVLHGSALREPPSTTGQEAGGPPPRPGEDFSACASRLAGFAGAVLGWAPDAFWRATPAELAVVVAALAGSGAGEAISPPDAATLARLREAFPDG